MLALWLPSSRCAPGGAPPPTLDTHPLGKTGKERTEQSGLARALIELGRIIKTLHILTYCDDATYRRDIQRILNRGESRNALARAVFHGQRGPAPYQPAKRTNSAPSAP